MSTPSSFDRLEPEEPPAPLLGIIRKLTRLSGILGEIDDWLDSRNRELPAKAALPLTLENLDEHIEREG